MQVVSKTELDSLKLEKGIGLGNFDGLHIGHMTLIEKLISESANLNIKSMIYTFINHPENIIHGEFITSQITSKLNKTEILKDTKLNYIYFQEFNELFSRMEAIDFLEKILIKKLNAKLILVGFNYRFGFKGKGNVEFLKKYENVYGYKLIVIPPVRLNDEIVSSTLIRNKIKAGDMESVKKLMGRDFKLSGDIITGKKIGRNLGFPTANISVKEKCVIPRYGVYNTRVKIDGIEYRALTNVGVNPTFENKDFSIETYILDFDDDVYGKNLEIYFISRLRDEIKFENKQELIVQINKDIDIVKNL